MSNDTSWRSGSATGPEVTMSDIFNTKAPVEWVPEPFVIYSPTRLDYFATRILQGLVAGRSEKDIRKTPKWAVALAKELVELLDQKPN